MSDSQSSGSSEAPRRNFFVRAFTAALGAFLGLVPAMFGLLFFFDPLLRKRKKGSAGAAAGEKKDAEGFTRLDVKLDTLPSDGTPMAFKVRDDKYDAWNLYKDVEVGTVWVRRTADDDVVAFSTICPHLGCAVDFRAGRKDFFCPCHTSAFDLEGERMNDIPPRGMDRLATKVNDQTGIWVKYETFLAGRKEQIATDE